MMDKVALAQFRRLSCLGLGGQQAITAMMAELPKIVPGARATLAWTEADGTLKDVWIGEVISSALAPFFSQHDLFVGPTEPSLENFACAETPFVRMEEWLGAEGIDRSNTFQGVFRPYRIGGIFSVPLRHAGKPIGAFICYRGTERLPFSADEEAELIGLSRYLRHAMISADERWDTIESDQRGVILCSPDGRILSQSPLARQLLIYAANDRLTADDRTEIPISVLPARFRRLCAAFARLTAGEPAHEPRMTVRNAWGEFEIAAQPLQTAAPGNEADPVCLIICRKEPMPLRLATRLRDEPLTHRQRELALHLALDRSVDDILDRMGIGAHTYRDYTRAVFAALGVSNRAQLLSRLLS